MDGLEIGEINLSDLERTTRIDAEFYKKENLAIAAQLKKTAFHPVTDFFTISDGNHMSISEAFQTEGIPYYRGQDIYNTFIEEASPICIDEDTYLHPHMIRSHLKSGDVLMSIVGAIVGNSAIVSSSNAATCSCKLSIIRSKNTGVLPEFLLIYIKTKYGQNQIQKFKRGAAQTGFLLEDFDQVFLPQLSMSFQEEIKRIVELSHFAVHQGDRVYNHAEQVFLSECEYQLPEREQITASVKTLSNSFLVSGRLDAEYYQPKYDALIEGIKKKSYKMLGGENGIVSIKKSIEPGSESYQNDGIPFIRVSNISKFEIAQPELFLPLDIVENPESLFPSKDTILFSKDGSVGIAFKVEEDMHIITSGALLHLTVQNTDVILPDYLTLVLNSPIVQLQAERDANGAIIQHWKPSEIEKVMIPVLDMSIQQNISDKVQESFALRRKSKKLLESAKQAIEMAIVQGEETALDWLKEMVAQ